MALASVSLRTSAQIIPLPSAAAQPVINPKRGAGRPPKNVISIQQAHRIRRRHGEQQRAQTTSAPVQFYPVPRSSSPWPFSRTSRADYDLLDEADRWFLENTVALTVDKHLKGRC